MGVFWGALAIFVARGVNMAMATVRTLLGMRGQKALSAVIGFFESVIFILAISQVLQNVNNIWNVLAYCGGFAAGTYVGLKIEERMAVGYATVQAISTEKGEDIAAALRERGYGVTNLVGEGMAGSVHVVNTAVKRRDVADILALVARVDGKAFVTVDDASRVYRGHWRGV
jgi:uncharacterized protein YebE (UPF0316 family)